MATFLLENGFYNSSSTTARGILLVGHLTPSTTTITPGSWLVFEEGRLLIIEVRTMHCENVGLTIDSASLENFEQDGGLIWRLYETEALIEGPG
ncbi:hypothetical protein [Hymenobacter negativus]|uniref:Uncharacterized protein n=1 Tax=Hymenobacter negativus TaxID=2795026 RepID=A0ABS3QFC3_9BACT|nr:hypothetical protein [Hymenobacter negativus]MBO2009956.1 hypothetical protein [Hymenobacter negativus]